MKFVWSNRCRGAEDATCQGVQKLTPWRVCSRTSVEGLVACQLGLNFLKKLQMIDNREICA